MSFEFLLKLFLLFFAVSSVYTHASFSQKNCKNVFSTLYYTWQICSLCHKKSQQFSIHSFNRKAVVDRKYWTIPSILSKTTLNRCFSYSSNYKKETFFLIAFALSMSCLNKNSHGTQAGDQISQK